MSRSLFQNRTFATLYAAQTINLLGDALTWVGLALLSYELAGAQGGSALLATALTLRVTAFVLVSPWAGVLADRIDRKKILLTTHLCRLGLMSMLPFVQHAWQLLTIVFFLNVFNGIFSPTYKATLPFVTGKDDYPAAIALSGTTYQLLGVVGPGVAGLVAAFVGVRQIFFLDALTFLIASLLVISIPNQLNVSISDFNRQPVAQKNLLQDWSVGSICLWRDRSLRYMLLFQLVASLSGAEILVNTVSYVQGSLNLGKVEYGWVMAAYGIGATIAAALLSRVSNRTNRLRILSLGGLLLSTVMLMAQGVSLGVLMVLWAIAGIGQSMIDLSAQTLIADRISVELQGRVYGAHFAWSHLWWVVAYPIAGGLAQSSPQHYFLISGAIALGLLIFIAILAKFFPAQSPGFWHEHSHEHGSSAVESHDHQHSLTHSLQHDHFHFHLTDHSIDSGH